MNHKTFWDDTFKNLDERMPYVGPTTYEEYVSFLGTIGPFERELEASDVVLDVGPGLGRFLAGCAREGQECNAIEISAVNTYALQERGVTCWTPGELAGIEDPFVDIATAISVFQHCDDNMVRTLLADVSAALRTGWTFWCNGIFRKAEEDKPAVPLRQDELPQFNRSLATVRRFAAQAGLSYVSGREYPVPKMPGLDAYIAMFRKV